MQPPGGEPADFEAKADFTDILADDNPDWRIDLNDDVIGRWRGENGRAGAVTLVWGRPLVRGAVAATAELDGETVDQELISQDRFTLIALDALEGYGDDIFMEVKLWSRRALELASESLYAPEDRAPRSRRSIPLARASRASKVSSGSSEHLGQGDWPRDPCGPPASSAPGWSRTSDTRLGGRCSIH